MQQIEFTNNQKTLLTIYSGEFDTPKKLNRSDKQVPKEFIEAIESSDVTSEQLSEIGANFPLFRYKTCLTIHGNFPTVQNSYIGGYKNIIQNKNGSLEIRHNAIDYNKKKELAKCLKGWQWSRNSTLDYFTKSFVSNSKDEAIQIYNDLKQKYEGLQFNGMHSKIWINGYGYFGRFYIILNVSPLLIVGNIVNLAAQMDETTESEILARLEANRIETEKREKEYKERVEQDAKRDEANNVAKAEKKAILSQYRRGEIMDGATLITVCSLVNGYGFMQVTFKKASFGRFTASYKVSKSLEFNGEVKEYRKGKQVSKSDFSCYEFYQVI